MQGCAADYIKYKSVRIYKYLKMNNYKTRPLMWVHDELIFEVHETEMFLVPILRTLLSEFDIFRTHITAGCEECVPDWGHKIDMSDVGFCHLSAVELEAVDKYDIWA